MPLIIHGTYPITFTDREGEFYCPKCGPDQGFTLKKWTKFFHIYWIPLIPCGGGKFLECRGCESTWPSEVENYDPEIERQKFQARYESAMLQAMIAMAQVDGVIDEDEINMIAAIMTRLSDAEYTASQIRQSLASTVKRPFKKIIGEVSGDLNDHGKTILLKGLYLIASADGEVEKREEKQINMAAKLLSVKPARLKEISHELSD